MEAELGQLTTAPGELKSPAHVLISYCSTPYARTVCVRMYGPRIAVFFRTERACWNILTYTLSRDL